MFDFQKEVKTPTRSGIGMSSVPYLVLRAAGDKGERERAQNQRLWNDNKISVGEGHYDAAENGRGKEGL